MRARAWIRRYRYLLATAAAVLSVVLAGGANWPRG
jgi:hypothetical protein